MTISCKLPRLQSRQVKKKSWNYWLRSKWKGSIGIRPLQFVGDLSANWVPFSFSQGHFRIPVTFSLLWISLRFKMVQKDVAILFRSHPMIRMIFVATSHVFHFHLTFIEGSEFQHLSWIGTIYFWSVMDSMG